MVPELRKFIRPFCRPDKNCCGDPPQYVVTTLQLDNLMGDLWRAKERKVINRFKLRIRTYGDQCQGPVFLELKRKIGQMVSKSRVSLPGPIHDLRTIFGDETRNSLGDVQSVNAYMDFVRLVNEIGARPRVYIRYHRESYASVSDVYGRVTLDSRLCYAPARQWVWPSPQIRWRSADTPTGLNRPYAGYILELKCGAQQPTWMADLVERFSLVQGGFCKYATAMRLESIFQGWQYSAASENCTY